MRKELNKFSERSLGRLIQRTLLAGITLSLLAFLLGFSCRLSGFQSAADRLLRTGVIMLIMTPVARVAMLAYGYWRKEESRFALASAAVLALLFLSVLL
jgi:hypothetical protein